MGEICNWKFEAKNPVFLNILKTKFSLQYFVIYLVNISSKSEFEDIFEKPLKFFLQKWPKCWILSMNNRSFGVKCKNGQKNPRNEKTNIYKSIILKVHLRC